MGEIKIKREAVKIKLGLAFCFFVFTTPTLWAQKEKDFGAGVILGSPNGLAMKYWLNPINAIDFGFGFDQNFTVHGDYLWHGWEIFKQRQEGKIGAYLGIGASLKSKKKDGEFGIRTVIGGDYLLKKYPVEIFLELVPLFRLTPSREVSINGGIGLRYYFKKFNK